MSLRAVAEGAVQEDGPVSELLQGRPLSALFPPLQVANSGGYHQGLPAGKLLKLISVK